MQELTKLQIWKRRSKCFSPFEQVENRRSRCAQGPRVEKGREQKKAENPNKQRMIFFEELI
jgi:hypothetical protein